MQPENSFDKLSKRLATAVSRRSLLRSMSLAVAGSFLPWKKALADDKKPTSAELETKFFAAPIVIELPTAGGEIELRCVAAVLRQDSDQITTGASSAGKEGDCPADVASYFENSDLSPEIETKAEFDKSKALDVRVVDGKSRRLKTYPIATSYSFFDPATGKQVLKAYCSSFTYLDPRVHKGDSDRKLIHYKRIPIPKQLTSKYDKVTCGGIDDAYENEIKTRKPTAIRNFSEDAVPHQASAKRVNATGTSTRNHSGHKSK